MSQNPTIRRRQVIALAGLLAALLLGPGPVGATGAVCPPGDVKYEVDGGYEYTDGSATITVTADAMTATWQPAAGHVVTGVCVKTGGPNGGWLIFPPPAAGTLTTSEYAISHVVLTTAPDQPNAVTVTEVQAVTLDRSYRSMILLIILVAACLFGLDVARHDRRTR